MSDTADATDGGESTKSERERIRERKLRELQEELEREGGSAASRRSWARSRRRPRTSRSMSPDRRSSAVSSTSTTWW